MGGRVESRFERYAEVIVEALGHADRATPARWYLRGLMLPGERKSVEPMAARVHPQDVRSAHQSMHHLVAESEWSDTALLGAVAREVAPVLSEAGEAPLDWVVDDTGFRSVRPWTGRQHPVAPTLRVRKYGKHSVGVARQYCGQLGKTENRQVAVTLSLCTPEGSLPLGYRLYLPREWAEDKERCERAGVPPEIGFATKGKLAWARIEAALRAGVPRGTVLMDAGYGDEAAMRDRLSAEGLPYAVGIRPQTAVWWETHQPAPAPLTSAHGRSRTRLRRDPSHRPISVLELAQRLPASSYRPITWREGTNAPLRSRFARVRVRAAQGARLRPEEWLLIEWPKNAAEPTHYWLSTLPPNLSFKDLVATVKMRWRIERDYCELKQELGLGHYEGRNWRGVHHHASLCIAAYGFLMLERLSGVKKNSARPKAPPLPQGFRPRGSRPDATAHPLVDRHRALPLSSGDRPTPSAMPMLWNTVCEGRSALLTQYNHNAASDGLQQAKHYAKMLGLKFAYATNGPDIIEFDYSTGLETARTDYPTPDDLWQRYRAANGISDTETANRLLAPCNHTVGKGERYYHQIAINRTVEAILKGRRRLLITMATGTGNTVVAFQICWKLWNARFSPPGYQ